MRFRLGDLPYNDMEKCNICPRGCGIDRNINKGFCGEKNTVRLARAALHFWEEPCISGDKGSGTVFFSGCNLRCVYCQNYGISRGELGKEVSDERLCEIFFELKAQGANNINLVTPTHFSLQIKRVVAEAKAKGLDLPIVWNTGGYEKAEMIASLDKTVDIYLTDFKYMSGELAEKYSAAKDYPETAKEALSEMVRTKGAPVVRNGLIKKGVIVRHLVLPGCVSDSLRIMDYLHSEYGDDIIISIMSQFTPDKKHLVNYPELCQKLTEYEYSKVVDYADKIGISLAYVQEGSAAKESFIPDFDYTGV